jgi:hypothetical protein
VVGVGVTLRVLSAMHGWLALAVGGVVLAQFGPVLVARRVRIRRKAAVPTGPGARGATWTGNTPRTRPVRKASPVVAITGRTDD